MVIGGKGNLSNIEHIVKMTLVTHREQNALHERGAMNRAQLAKNAPSQADGSSPTGRVLRFFSGGCAYTAAIQISYFEQGIDLGHQCQELLSLMLNCGLASELIGAFSRLILHTATSGED